MTALADLQERLMRWQVSLSKWETSKPHFVQYKSLPELYLCLYLENLLEETYNGVRAMSQEVAKMRTIRITKDLSQIPYYVFVLVCAEYIEPSFAARLAYAAETKVASYLENKVSQEDYLGYLLCSNIEEGGEAHANALSSEVEIVFGIFMKQQKSHKNAVTKLIEGLRNYHDITLKQFIVVLGLRLEPEYRRRFMPEEIGPDTKLLAAPSRFIPFVTKTLPFRYTMLENGTYSGVLEFMNEIRPSYFMYETPLK